MKFRSKAARSDAALEEAEALEQEQQTPVQGPFDVDDHPDDGVTRVDLGSLILKPETGRELRLQVDERTQEVQAVILTGKDGALELRAFAAPRNGDLWSTVRPQVAADMARRGGTATEQEGPFGPELLCQVSMKNAEGRTGIQHSRIVGVNGSRWMLRATFLGRPAQDAESAAAWEETLRNTIVRRGEHAMPVGDPLPVTLPADARRVNASGQ